MNLLTSRSTTGRHPCCRGVRRSRAVAGALFRSRRQGFYKRGCAFGLTQVGIGKALILHKDHKESKGMTWEAFWWFPHDHLVQIRPLYAWWFQDDLAVCFGHLRHRNLTVLGVGFNTFHVCPLGYFVQFLQAYATHVSAPLKHCQAPASKRAVPGCWSSDGSRPSQPFGNRFLLL